MAEPVLKAVLLGMGVGISGGFELLVVVGIDVELRPDADHEPGVHSVDIVKHLLRVRIPLRIKLMTAPLVFFPILPVLDNVVDGNMPPTHL